jgi:hypothetical protein
MRDQDGLDVACSFLSIECGAVNGTLDAADVLGRWAPPFTCELRLRDFRLTADWEYEDCLGILSGDTPRGPAQRTARLPISPFGN